MTILVKITAVFFIVSSIFAQGFYSIEVYHMKSINTTAGQNISLPCIIDTDGKSISQIHWKKITAGDKEHSIVIFNPLFPLTKNWDNISLDIMGHGQKLRGSVLQLQEVDNWASGQYMCELTTFPDGTVKTVTNLLVIDVKLSASVTWLNQGAGGEVKAMILCNSTPSADNYSLWPSKNKSSVLRNKTGLFLLQEVMRESDDVYVCQTEWLPLHPLHGQNLTTQVRVCCKCDEPSHSHKGCSAISGQEALFLAQFKYLLLALLSFRIILSL